MCEYIKDDGEQCGIDSHDGKYCHLHEENESVADAARDSSACFDGHTMDAVCDNCETPLRRRERLTEHPNHTRRALFEAYVECDCHELILGTTSVRESSLPNGWSA